MNTASGTPEPGPFVLGLTMAGAISGGAYAAGVMSYLTEALDAWEAARGQPGVPDHRVVLKAISGASAGGICGALGAISLAEPVTADPPLAEVPQGITAWEGLGTPIPMALPRLFRAWVKGPCLVSPDGGTDLLGTRDLAPDPQGRIPPVTGLLDSTRLYDVAMEAIAPLPAPPAQRPWVARRLHLFLTHTDMRGVPYTLAFNGNRAGHGMMAHADRVHYVISHGPECDGSVPDNAWLRDDRSKTTLHLPTLLSEDQPGTPPKLEAFAIATLATSAFPVGFSARAVAHLATDWDHRPMPIPVLDGTRQASHRPWLTLKADWTSHPGYPGNAGLATTVWDGGCLDNEPFQYARWSIMRKPPEGNLPKGEEADRAVLMIDPFPEQPKLAGEPDVADTALAAVLGRVKDVFVNSARFKPEEIAAALDETIYSRFLISPKREGPNGEELLGGEAIASGGLSGFGGTLHEAFRLHDFQLGRRNCQAFLAFHFGLPVGNTKVFGKDGSPAGQRLLDPAKTKQVQPDSAPIIPRVGRSAEEIPQLPWPRIHYRQDLLPILDRIGLRAQALKGSVLNAERMAPLPRLFIRFLWWLGGEGGLRNAVRWRLFRDLLARDQIEGRLEGASGRIEDLTEMERQVIWLLADTSYDGWSEAAIKAERTKVRLLHMKPETRELQDVLRGLERRGWIMRLRGELDVWHLAAREPGIVRMTIGQWLKRIAIRR